MATHQDRFNPPPIHAVNRMFFNHSHPFVSLEKLREIKQSEDYDGRPLKGRRIYLTADHLCYFYNSLRDDQKADFANSRPDSILGYTIEII